MAVKVLPLGGSVPTPVFSPTVSWHLEKAGLQGLTDAPSVGFEGESEGQGLALVTGHMLGGLAHSLLAAGLQTSAARSVKWA